MAKKIFFIVSMICIVAFLSLAGLVGVMMATGRLDAEAIDALTKILHGEPLVEETVDVETAEIKEEVALPAGDQVKLALAMDRKAEDMAGRLIEGRKEELAHQLRQLENLRQRIEGEREELKAEREAWAKEILAHRQKVESEAFKKQLKLYETMQAKQVKDVFLGMSEDLAASYLGAMNQRTAAKVISQFKSGAERTFLRNLLDRMRSNG